MLCGSIRELLDISVGPRYRPRARAQAVPTEFLEAPQLKYHGRANSTHTQV